MIPASYPLLQFPVKRIILTLSTLILISDLGFSRSTPLESAGCLCDLYGTVDPDVCDLTSDAHRCLCKDGHIGSDCSTCLHQYYRPSPTEVCRECQCSSKGSVDTSCDSDGACQCKPGFSGNRCDACENGFYLTETGGACRQCECEKLHPCIKHRDSGTQCVPCLADVSWAKRCNVCDSGYDVVITGKKLQCLPPGTMDMESTNGSISRSPGDTTHPGLPMTTVYALIVVSILIFIVVIFLLAILHRKRWGPGHPANFPFWTVELRQDDVTALASNGNDSNGNDMDVMYLDDTYLMNTPENFTTTVDSVHEDDHIGYHTLK